MLYEVITIVFGEALLEAVKQDQTGGAPRISLEKSAVETVHSQLAFYGESCQTIQYEDILQDADDTIFLNYLNQALRPAAKSRIG